MFLRVVVHASKHDRGCLCKLEPSPDAVALRCLISSSSGRATRNLSRCTPAQGFGQILTRPITRQPFSLAGAARKRSGQPRYGNVGEQCLALAYCLGV